MPRYAGEIDSEFINNIVRSSPLHDIGKVGVPDRILLKPGRFTPEEFDIMKRHATIGGDILRNLVEKGQRQKFLEMGMLIAYFHHERFNGTGYPSGLAGKDIPLPARILALADVYDALTSRRVYKDAMPHEEAAAQICGESGKHFDPDVVEAFERCKHEFEKLAKEMADSDEMLHRFDEPALVEQN
jgi:putative two-component system response regulator